MRNHALLTVLNSISLTCALFVLTVLLACMYLNCVS